MTRDRFVCKLRGNFSVIKKKKIFKTKGTAASRKVYELVTRQTVGLVDGDA